MFKVAYSKKYIQKKLDKEYQKLNYNQFRWWRWYDTKNKPLPYKASFRDKIMNGDYECSPFLLQARLCEHLMNEIWDECMPDIQKYNEKCKLLGARRKRLYEDHDKDENNKLQDLYKQFEKNFRITKDELNKEIDICIGTILDLYYQVEEKYSKIYIKSRRGRPAKK